MISEIPLQTTKSVFIHEENNKKHHFGRRETTSARSGELATERVATEDGRRGGTSRGRWVAGWRKLEVLNASWGEWREAARKIRGAVAPGSWTAACGWARVGVVGNEG
ncbi:hypothetical protein L484_006114 [Morus notabilis]|uniref:Uncharacterized protein n=1 Tax=Morus notabilis TaxID=981085 RepID=W9SAR8_9ROSA|nr:hypothetical protein L484_006114 [Morus notabilis]